MFEVGEVATFFINNHDVKEQLKLAYCGNDEGGFKFKGFIPYFWINLNEQITGPPLTKGKLVFKVNKINYLNDQIWISNVDCSQ